MELLEKGRIMNISGIYKIVNTQNGKLYIGSAKNIHKRWMRHLNDLRNNNHCNILLQRSFIKYGELCFKIEIIEKTSDLLDREQYFLDKLKPFAPNGYNIGCSATGGDNLSNNPNKKNIVKKITKAIKKRYKNMSDEDKKKYSEKMKGKNNPNYGNKWSKAQREAASKRSLGKKMSKKTRLKMSEAQKRIWSDEQYKEQISTKRKGSGNAFYGKKHSDKTKKHISKLHKARYQNMTLEEKQKIIPHMKQISIDGKIYNSMTDAAIALGVCVATISYRIKSTNPKFKNYRRIN